MSNSGFVLLDKIAGETSFKALFPLKRVFSTKRVGHAGTLDLRASGLIIAATGRCTRLLPFIEAKDKCYSFRLHLGYETDTLEWDGEVVEQDEREFGVRNSEFSVDKEGVILSETKCSLFDHLATCCLSGHDPRMGRRISRADVERVLPQFSGDIEQIPPKYCAVKINGVRASDLMERGRNIELKPRKIRISELKVIGEGEVTEGCSGKEFATFDLICECSKGTYIRALGRDIGRALGTYACVSQIRRHRIGNVAVESAVRGENLTRENLLPVDAVLDFPVVRLTPEQVAVIRQGNWLPWKEKIEGVGPEGHVFAADMQGEVLSLCFYEPGRIKPKFYLGEDEK
ncbi:pseudouridine synthase [Fibrobacter sp. UWB1]|uniref:tRNA pseudouridine synthase B n=1 Tax=Fibrobacter sp. UWB1 TaxID=1964355 RepID=UPI000B51E86B|nr:pseudouridine synthase [Fibrobacter sp. UWB1]OWV27400.1 pseudouridine synthase [Fibrobacter sp. UWB1]